MCDDPLVFQTVLETGGVGRTNRWGRPIFWRDAPPKEPEEAFEEGGFYDGAVRIWGADSDEGRLARQLGNAHAVSDGTTPSP